MSTFSKSSRKKKRRVARKADNTQTIDQDISVFQSNKDEESRKEEIVSEPKEASVEIEDQLPHCDQTNVNNEVALEKEVVELKLIEDENVTIEPLPQADNDSIETLEQTKVDDQIALEKEIAELIKEEQATIARYKNLKKSDANHTDLYTKEITIGDVSKMGRRKPKVIASFHTDDFRFIHKEANNVFLDNELNKTGQFVANSHESVSLQWVFDPKVIIDRETYLFLCQVFNVVHGSNKLDYKNFLNAFISLNPSRASQMEKKSEYANRTVFQFSHVVETDEMIYIPPIGGVHPEHKSSRFNHIQVRKFLMHGGAHPYFFRLLQR